MIDRERIRFEAGGRLDLRSLDAAADHRRSDAVIRAVMSSITRGAISLEIVPTLGRLHRGMAAAAVLFALMAAITVLFERGGDRAAGDGMELLERWAQSSHVPSNGELLTVYQGYRP
jgi:hypothetical protein